MRSITGVSFKGMGNHWALAATGVLASVGLAGCPTVDLGDTPSQIALCNPAKGLAYFISDIEPKYFLLPDPVNGCAKGGCHDLQHGGLALQTATPVDDAANYRATQEYISCGNPMASELLEAPLAGVEGHSGGDIFPNVSDPRVVDLLAWFQ